MKIEIQVIPNAKRKMIKKDASIWKVYLTESAVKGKANKALIVYLAKHLGKKPREVQLTKGLKSRSKTITIL